MKKSYKHLIRFIKEFIKEGGEATWYCYQVKEMALRINGYYDISCEKLIHDCYNIKERAGKVYTRKIK